MVTSIVSVTDGPRTTVSDLVGSPLAIPTRIIDILKAGLISETLLRNAGSNSNGLVQFSESTPLFLGSDVENVAEFAEIPVGAGQIGTPRVAYALRQGLGVRVSKEMIDENRLDDVNRQIKQLANTFIRADDRAARTILDSAPTLAASAVWSGGTGKPRKDIANAIEKVASAQPDGTGYTADEYLGFEANTIVVHPALAAVLIDNEDILKVYKDVLTPESIAYTGKLPKQILGLDVLTSRSFPLTKALVLERGTVGFYSDTRPLQSTALYPEGNGPNGGPTESYRSDTTIKRAVGLDQPKAAVWITGIGA
ncbi:major capsid protein [Rhodococcus phage Mbo4]|uniref:Major capsid protein n=2 Tax=root TaxID=1 RepID=A0A9E7IMH5_9CAUD|nr:hypothetical protein [Rhodococcus opacus]YP_010755911.1 major capsid protein [Rhodococcus phage Mbo4]EKT83047.1 hypothetical protein WSS_A09027 [Rhodococcus opacus M213]URG17496.1 major capsid protein [Rhodococcus phage Mbo4]